MLEGIYTTLIVLGFFLLVGGLISGASKQKLGVTVSLLLLSTIIFSVLGLQSFNIEREYCENQVTQSLINGSTTNYANQISCTTQQHVDEGLGILFGSMIFLTVAFMLLFILSGRDKSSWD